MADDSRKEPWMPLLVERYKRDTELLTTEQHGAYLLLLMYGWQHAGRLPGADAQLATITRLSPARWRAQKPVLMPFFRDDGDGGLVQKRLMLEVERARKLSAVRAEAGRLRSKPAANAEQLLQQTGSKTAAKAPANDEQTTQQNGPFAAAIAEQMGDYRGSPIPTSPSASSPSDDPLHPTPLAIARSARATPGEACKAMKEAGLADVNPSNPKLRALLEQDATVDEMRAAATKAVSIGKGFGYALGIVKGDREEAARIALAPRVEKKRSPFLLPPGHVRVLPDDLPDLEMRAAK